MILLSPSSMPKECLDKKLVFLAGPIKGAECWQDKAIADLADMDIYIANPRRDGGEGFDYDKQVEWETYYLRRADVIMFWIPPEAEKVDGRSYAQTSRFELGEWLGRTDFNHCADKAVVVGIDNAFPGKSYVVKRCQNSPCQVFDSYDETLAEVRRRIGVVGNVFFTSDTHFGSQRALELSKRPFVSVNDMNWSLVANWNRIVKEDDVVWHLGDFGDLRYAMHLNGKIHLVLGNYETDEIKRNPAYLDELKQIFASVDLSREIVTSDGETLHLSHKPSGADKDIFNAFGHIHGRQKCKKFGCDVGVDANHFMPMREADVLFCKNAVARCYDEEVFL